MIGYRSPSYHSIRKVVVTKLENAGVPENVVASIIGHEVPTLTFGLYSWRRIARGEVGSVGETDVLKLRIT